ncbi:hypothetical protein D3C72_2494680 [compost metagenome]
MTASVNAHRTGQILFQIHIDGAWQMTRRIGVPSCMRLPHLEAAIDQHLIIPCL